MLCLWLETINFSQTGPTNNLPRPAAFRVESGQRQSPGESRSGDNGTIETKTHDNSVRSSHQKIQECGSGGFSPAASGDDVVNRISDNDVDLGERTSPTSAQSEASDMYPEQQGKTSPVSIRDQGCLKMEVPHCGNDVGGKSVPPLSPKPFTSQLPLRQPYPVTENKGTNNTRQPYSHPRTYGKDSSAPSADPAGSKKPTAYRLAQLYDRTRYDNGKREGPQSRGMNETSNESATGPKSKHSSNVGPPDATVADIAEQTSAASANARKNSGTTPPKPHCEGNTDKRDRNQASNRSRGQGHAGGGHIGSH